MTTSDFDLERDLTAAEITARGKERDALDEERDALDGSIADRRREIRGFNARRRKIEARLRDLRREIRSGKVIDSPQTSLALDAPMPDDPFSVRYPMARDADRLHGELSVALDGVLVPSIETLEKWHADTGIFQAFAHWARVELAYRSAKEHPDLRLPTREPMPRKLAELRADIQRAVSQFTRKKRATDAPPPAHKTRAAKVRAAGGTPARTGQGRRTRGARA